MTISRSSSSSPSARPVVDKRRREPDIEPEPKPPDDGPSGLVDQLTKADWTFAAAIVVMAALVGMSPLEGPVVIQLLIILSAALAGMTIPYLPRGQGRRSTEANREPTTTRSALEEAEARQRREADEQALRHDMAAAWLTIEGGISAIRSVDPDQDSTLVPIVDAIDAEIQRVRRLTERRVQGEARCEVALAVTPIVALHQACGMTITSSLAPALVTVPGDDLARVVANLLDNCSRHAPAARVAIAGETCQDRYRITIVDDGPGLDSTIEAPPTDLGVTTRPGGGIGLHSALEILGFHDGELVISPEANDSGFEVTLYLPLAAERRTRRPPGDSSEALVA